VRGRRCGRKWRLEGSFKTFFKRALRSEASGQPKDFPKGLPAASVAAPLSSRARP
jgi:hypothetical protein